VGLPSRSRASSSVTLSYEVGARKPDPKLFEDALAKLGLMAELRRHKVAF